MTSAHPIAAFIDFCRKRQDVTAALPGGVYLGHAPVTAGLPRAIIDPLDGSIDRSTGTRPDQTRIRSQTLQVRVVAASAAAAAAAADALALLDRAIIDEATIHVCLDLEIGPYPDPPDAARSGPDGSTLYVVVLQFTISFNDLR